ncbi:MAG: stage II sporulation protein D [Clostridiales bacterium]|nr:stage II sporulation protein D [Clostridiales bacterium]
MLSRLNIKKIIIIILTFSLTVIMVRGIIFAVLPPQIINQITGERLKPEDIVFDEVVTVSVFDVKNNKVVNMGLEEYVFCVTAAEIPASYELEAIKAQSIAARTYAVTHINELFANSKPCKKGLSDVCTDSGCCQAFNNIEGLFERWGSSASRYASKVYEAVKATKGQIISYQGEPILALFHASSGGVTENSENVFSDPLPYLVSVDSPNEEFHTHFADTEVMNSDYVAKKINESFPNAKLEKDKLSNQLKILERYPTGRVKTLKIGDTTCTGRDLRNTLGLYSANFSLKFENDKVIISTIGFGHGVGMSQAGANAMAQGGNKYEEILTHYYQNTEIVSVYPKSNGEVNPP